MKNYALLDGRGSSVKGSGFRSRGLELFQRRSSRSSCVSSSEGGAPGKRPGIDRW